jgi:hypothetical protein
MKVISERRHTHWIRCSIFSFLLKCFAYYSLVLCSFDHCIVSPSSSYCFRLLLCCKPDDMDEERTGLRLRQTERVRNNLWHIYSVTVNRVIVAVVKHSKWLLQLNRIFIIIIYIFLLLLPYTNTFFVSLKVFLLQWLIRSYMHSSHYVGEYSRTVWRHQRSNRNP